MNTYTEPTMDQQKPFNGMTDPVIAFLESYTGNNDFLQSVRTAHFRYGLTDRQYNAVQKFVENQNRPQPTSTVDLSSLPEGTTYHAVESTNQLSFYRIDRPTEAKWAGWTFVKQVIGGGMSGGAGVQERRGSQRPDGTYRGQHESQMAAIIADPTASMQRFGQEIGRCGRCNRLLTDETSRAFGIGPECRSRLGA